jgi:20S proteasome alpha/beta subunit
LSLLICLVGIDGLVLAADSRGTFGDPRGVTAQNDLIKKLYLVNPRVGILVAGAGDLGSTIVAGLLAMPDIASLGVTGLTEALHTYAQAQFRLWFDLFSLKPTTDDPRPVRPVLNFLIAGFELDGRRQIYRLSSSLDFAPMLHNYGFGTDGVAQYALYLLNRLYDPACDVKELEYLAAYVITETASQDGKVGGPVQIAAITMRDSLILDLASVEHILAANRERSTTLKKSFWTTPDAVGRDRHSLKEGPAAKRTPGEPGIPALPEVANGSGKTDSGDSASTTTGKLPEELLPDLAW